MKRILNYVAITSLTAFLSGAVSTAYGDEENCQKIRGRMTTQDVQFPCQIDPAFGGCFILDFNGTFQSLMSFTQVDWFVLLDPLGFPTPAETLSNYNREVHVYSSPEGTVTGDVQYVFDLRIFSVDGGFVTPAIITSGTGIYEGATGWIVSTFLDGALQRASVKGRVCGPNIPDRDEDGDSDSDSDSDD